MTSITPTIAYLITAHAVNKQLALLVDALLSDSRSRIYIHIDAKTRDLGWLARTSDERIVVLTNRTAVNWGGLSITDAIRSLLEAALRDAGNVRFVLLSGACFPLREPRSVGDAILERAEPRLAVWGRIDATLARNEGLGRYVVTKFHPLDVPSINPKRGRFRALLWNLYKIINNALPYERKVRTDDLWRGSLFFLITRELALHFVAPHDELARDLRFGLASDELFFTTLYVRWARARNAPLVETDTTARHQAIHYIRKWKPPNRGLFTRLFVPVDLRALDHEGAMEAIESDALFARKCSAEISQGIMARWRPA
ncbi:hypothetical protein JUN65_16145 [Gluconacetobacter azotocaptans]|uniref:beta-1,6-N-acetylglucosaminyltransferase n=1 Tax=Gluconacetobacter azotocaptans TaxID=142834 RepID=UPI0019581819|nr:beta-1,6-N-acetylglucosaminyltransferase [Gluconacetobacter azotocaptans]MBM9403110.1 hypothetical protein [Gluconacetobacter azotocaptans]